MLFAQDAQPYKYTTRVTLDAYSKFSRENQLDALEKEIPKGKKTFAHPPGTVF